METTLRIRTQAELSSLREYVSLLREAAPLAAELRASGGGGRRSRPPAGGADTGADVPMVSGGSGGLLGGLRGGGGAGGSAGGGGGGGGGITTRELLFGPGGGHGGSIGESISQAGGLAGLGKGQIMRLGGIAGGIALGGGLLSMLLGAGQRYAALSQMLQTLEQRFRSSGREAANWGVTLGMTSAKVGPLLEQLGAGTDVVNRRSFRDLLGFARWRGIDPSAMMGAGASAGRRGESFDSRTMMALLGTANESNVNEGRLPEHFEAYSQLAESAFGVIGRADPGAAIGAQRIAGGVFGASDARAQGQRAADFASRMNSVLTGGGPGMRSYMMRAMGFGTAGGPSYIEMRKRMERGVFDSRNMTDLFGLMQAEGLTKGQMFRGLEGVAGGQLKAHEIEALVNALGTQDKRDAFSQFVGGGDLDTFAAKANLTAEERAMFASGGLAKLGRTGIAAGDRHELLMEGRTKEYGPKSLQIQDSLLRIGDDLVGLIGKFVTGGMLVRLAEGIEGLTNRLDRMANPHELPAAAGSDVWSNLRFMAGDLSLGADVGQGALPNAQRGDAAARAAAAGASTSSQRSLGGRPRE